MSKVELLRECVQQRLTAAAEQIFELFERTVLEYEEELRRSKQENQRQQKLLEAAFKPQVQLHSEEVHQLVVIKEEVAPEHQGWSFTEEANPEEPEETGIPRIAIKEEEEELWVNQEEANVTVATAKCETNREEPDTSELHHQSPGDKETGVDSGGAAKSPPPREPEDAQDNVEDLNVVEVQDEEQENGGPSNLKMVIKKVVSGDVASEAATKKFTCTDCGKGFAYRSLLLMHEKTHTGEKPFSCSECDKRFTIKGSLKRHQQIHIAEKLIGCSEFRNNYGRSELARNLDGHSGPHVMYGGGNRDAYEIEEKKNSWYVVRNSPGVMFVRKSTVSTDNDERAENENLTCYDCGKTFPHRSLLLIHQKTHLGEKPFSCFECGKRFTLKGSLKRHQRMHIIEKPFGCRGCGKRFRSSHQLQKHNCGQYPPEFNLREDYGEPSPDGLLRPLDDDEGQEFCEIQDSENHMMEFSGTRSTTDENLRCSQCGKSFACNALLLRHMITHTGEKPFVCPECGKAFSYKTSLTTHMKAHSGEKPFACSECDKSFLYASLLKIHMVKHNEGKMFSCSVCGKAFKRRVGLKKHAYLHWGGKPYKCSQCGKRFLHMESLKNHERKHAAFSWSEFGEQGDGACQ